MKLSTCILVLMAWSPLLGCAAQETFPPDSPLSWLRNRVFGSRRAEDRFVSRVATAMQSLVNLVNDPIVVRELRRYYASLLRSPEVAKLVESVRPPNRPTRRRGSAAKTSRTSTTTTMKTPILSSPTSRSTTAVPSTVSTTAGPTTTSTPVPSTSRNVSSGPLRHVTSRPVMRRFNKYPFYFDPMLVVQPTNSSYLRARVRRHLNLVRMNDVENCVSFLICEMSRYPLRFGPLGVKVDRFFRYPMWDTGSSAAHYAAMARNGRRYGCRGRISSCRHPIGPLYRHHYKFQYGNLQ